MYTENPKECIRIFRTNRKTQEHYRISSTYKHAI